MPLLLRTPTRYYFVSIFIVVSALFFTFSVVIYRHYAQAQRLNQWTLYNYELMRQGRKILFDLVSMETGIRGYLLSGNSSFLEPYEKSRRMLSTEINVLWDYTKNDPNTHDDLDAWLKKIERFSAGLNQQVVNYRQQGKLGISQSSLEKQKLEMDELRSLLEGFIQNRLENLQQQITKYKVTKDNFKYILAIGTILGIGGVLLLILLFIALSKRSQKAEDATRALEARFQTVMNGVNDGLYDYNITAGSIYYSPTYKAMLGYKDNEFPNTLEMSHKLIHPDDLATTLEKVQQFINGDSLNYSNIFRMQHKDESWIWIHSRGVGFRDETGKIVRLIGTHTDITEHKNREEELTQLNNEMETFTYITSHDLRAPLVNLKGFANEMDRAIQRVHPIVKRMELTLNEEEKMIVRESFEQDIPESLRFIEQSVERMDALTTAVLDLSRIGKREYRFEPVDMNVLVRRCLDTLAYEIAQKNIQVDCSDLPNITSDALALEQVCSNILDNAVKYLDPNRPMRITISSRQTGNDVIFSFEDNGRGIAPLDRDKVFQIFRRARNTNDVRGMGMGMTYVQATLRRLGGNIWFESTPGSGTTFHFNLPKSARARSKPL